MPAFTFNAAEGTEITNSTNLTLNANQTITYLLNNYSGTAVKIFLQASANVEVQVITASGSELSLGSGDNFNLDGDETVTLRVVNGAGSGTWRISSADTTHGTPATRGTGHTAGRMRFQPQLVLGTV